MQRQWVFGYGSLMWNPGFGFTERISAQLSGFHRSLCLFSHQYRGTAERPGLVLALDEGGTCEGVAFAVSEAQWPVVHAYLREREQINYVYLEKMVPITLLTGERVEAITYIADRNHHQYAGKLSLEETLHYVRQGVGSAGLCTDYVRNTLAHLRDIGVYDAYLEQIVAQLG